MIRISVNVLSIVHILMTKVIKYSITDIDSFYAINNYQLDTNWVIGMVSKCKWMCISDKGISITDRGYEIFGLEKYLNKNVYRLMLYDYIINFRPTWAFKIPLGRKETALIMSNDEKACFYEAELLDDFPSKSSIEWWDSLSAIFRNNREEKNNEIGRKGEYLTTIFEKERTGVMPEWVALDSNLVGYDILSKKCFNEDTIVLIEVKSSSAEISSASCHISEHEWNVACTSKNYKFYLWLIGKEYKLAILDPTHIAPYIPTNNSTGMWESVKIPFTSFANQFNTIKFNIEDVFYE